MNDQGFPKLQIPADIDQNFDSQVTELISNVTSINSFELRHQLRCGGSEYNGYYLKDDGGSNSINYLYRSVSEGMSKAQEHPFLEQEDMFLPSIQEYVDLFDKFAVGADLSTTISDYPGCRAGFEKSFKSLYYTIKWYTTVFGGTDVSNANFLTHINNITSTLTSTTDFVSKCLTSAENTQVAMADYIILFPALSDYMLAFLMNLTGNILSMYNIFLDIMTASASCDYSMMATKIGGLVKRLYSVLPIESASGPRL